MVGPSKLLRPSGEWREWRFGQVRTFCYSINHLNNSCQILAFVLLYPSIEGFWNHIVYPAVRRSDRAERSGNETKDISAITGAESVGDEKYGHERELSFPRSKGISHSLYRIMSPESATSFPLNLTGSSLSVLARGVVVWDLVHIVCSISCSVWFIKSMQC